MQAVYILTLMLFLMAMLLLFNRGLSYQTLELVGFTILTLLVLCLAADADTEVSKLRTRCTKLELRCEDLAEQLAASAPSGLDAAFASLETNIAELTTAVDALEAWQTTTFPTHSHPPSINDVTAIRLQESLTILQHQVNDLAANIQRVENFPLLTIEADKSAALRLQEILDTFERVQNAQAHMATREWMLDLERFKSASEMIRAMYRELGVTALPDDAQKMMETRIKTIATDLFKLADEQRSIRNDQAEHALFPPPPHRQIDERDVLALKDLDDA